VGQTLRVRHGLPINVHRRLDAGMAHQLLLDGERRSSFVQPGPVAVPERMPTDIAADSGCNPGFPDMLLLDLLLMVGPARDRVSEQPALRTGECAIFV
jgi:hypothetical protein